MLHINRAFLFAIFCFICILFCNGRYLKYSKPDGKVYQENHGPEVRILRPAMNDAYDWNTLIPYSVRVSDKEDGESDYNEIPANEVFLEVRSLKAPPKPGVSLKTIIGQDPKGLALIKTSNCLNCHTQREKLIGPSFADIGERYTYTPANVELLVKRIRAGSKGVWGNVVMPTHPELTTDQTTAITKWILQTSKASDIDFYKGIEGSFRLRKPANPSRKTFLVIASYTDHGLKNTTAERLTGQDAVIVSAR